MQNEAGQSIDIYIPRKWCVSGCRVELLLNTATCVAPVVMVMMCTN